MRAPQLVIVETDGWIARLLAELSADSKWLVRTTRATDTAVALVRERRPSVLVVQVDPADERPTSLELISDVSRRWPDVPVVAVSDTKMNDADRTAWTAALFDLGARYVLFPPLTKPVLEDAVSGLMAAAARRAGLEPATAPPSPAPGPAPAKVKAKRPRKPVPTDDVIDLADDEVHE